MKKVVCPSTASVKKAKAKAKGGVKVGPFSLSEAASKNQSVLLVLTSKVLLSLQSGRAQGWTFIETMSGGSGLGVHSLTWPSLLPEASVAPSGETARAQISFRWPWSPRDMRW